MCRWTIDKHKCGHLSRLYVRPHEARHDAYDRARLVNGDIDLCAPTPPEPLVNDVNFCCNVHCCATDILVKYQDLFASRANYGNSWDILRNCRKQPGQAPHYAPGTAEFEASEAHQLCDFYQVRYPDNCRLWLYQTYAQSQAQAWADMELVRQGRPPMTFWGGWGRRGGRGSGRSRGRGRGSSTARGRGRGRRRGG